MKASTVGKVGGPGECRSEPQNGKKLLDECLERWAAV